MSDRRPRPPLLELIAARSKEFTREPEAVFWVLLFPILLSLALGLAFREKSPERIPIGVVEGPDAPPVYAALAHSPALTVRSYEEVAGRRALATGRISLLVLPGRPPVYSYDTTRPDARSARLEVDDALQSAAGRPDLVKAREEHVTEKGSRYIDFVIPGLLGMNLMGTGMWGIGFAVVNARSRKLLKRFLATPMRKSDYLLAQVLYRLAFLAVEVPCFLGFAALVFGVPVKGTVVAVTATILVGALAFSGLGLLVASRARTIEGVSGLMNLVMLPMWLMSGVFFSSDRFPAAAQPLIHALPLTQLNDALRAVMLEGAGLAGISGQLIPLCAWAAVSFAIALKIFRWS
jgi:ABC-type multidrug transport system permease subunit